MIKIQATNCNENNDLFFRYFHKENDHCKASAEFEKRGLSPILYGGSLNLF